MNRRILTYLFLVFLAFSCSGGDEPDVNPTPGPTVPVSVDNVLCATRLRIGNEEVAAGRYDFGLFVMKREVETQIRNYIPENAFHFNVHDNTQISAGGEVVSERFLNSVDTVYIDSLKQNELCYLYSYYPFMKTSEEPSATSYSYYGGNIPYEAFGGSDILVSRAPVELHCEQYKSKSIGFTHDMQHTLTQFLFFISNNTESDTLVFSSLSLVDQKDCGKLCTSVLLDVFQKVLRVDTTVVASQFNTVLSPGIVLLPGETSTECITLNIPPFSLPEDLYGALEVRMRMAYASKRDSTFWADTLKLPAYDYKAGDSHAMLVQVRNDGIMNHTLHWGIVNWDKAGESSTTGGTHLQSDAYIAIVPWANLRTVDGNVSEGAPSTSLVVYNTLWSNADSGSNANLPPSSVNNSFSQLPWLNGDSNSGYTVIPKILQSYYNIQSWSVDKHSVGYTTSQVPSVSYDIDDWNHASPTEDKVGR